MRTALIGIDYIIDIMHPTGKIARSAAQAAERQVIGNFNAATAIAAQRDWPVILVKVGFDGYRDHPAGSPLFGPAKAHGALDLGGPGTEFHPDLDTTGAMVVVKPRVNAFFGTRLAQILSAAHIQRVVIAGVSTAMAVQSTARDAHDRDFQVIIAEDACAAATLAEHEASVDMLRPLATIISSADLATVR